MNSRAFRAALMMAVALPMSVLLMTDQAAAQASDLGSVTVTGGAKPAPRKKVKQTRAARAAAQRQVTQVAAPTAAPLASDKAIGSGAPAGSAPALAPSQGSLNSSQPLSIVSDKIIKDVVKAGADYNETAKFTPGFVSNNANAVGDSKSGWRGYKDGQFNITFDGIPFGDANDPTHHSAAYFPASFLSRVTVDRSPGGAAQAGYAPFGGTLGLGSLELSDKAGASVQSSFGSFKTFTTNVSGQSGYYEPTGTRALVAFSHIRSDGQLSYGDSQTYQGLIKLEKQLGEVKITALATGGTERYTNVNSITYAQWQKYGKDYGQVNANPNSQQFYGYNNSLKATDLEYIRADWSNSDTRVDNTAYTLSYWYPRDQNNGQKQSLEYDPATASSGGGLPSLTFPTVNGVKYYFAYDAAKNPLGVRTTDVTGYLKYNNYRSWGDTLNVAKDVDLPNFKGTFKAGMWVETVSNDRYQKYIDYSTGVTYDKMNASTTSVMANATYAPSNPLWAYRLNLNSKITTFQPYAEYEWKATDRFSITPGVKYASFTRDHNAEVNDTSELPMHYKHTYSSTLPFLAARYKMNDETTVYAQATKGYLAPTVAAFYQVAPDTSQIQPQQTTNYQAGVVYKTEDWTLSGDVYRVTATNFPVFNKQADGSSLYENAGTARYQGVELEGTYALINGFAAYASGALIKAKYVEGKYANLRVGGAPTYTLAGGFVYDDQTYFGSLIHKVVGSSFGSSGERVGSSTTDSSLNKIGSYNSTDFVAGMRTDVLKKMGFGEKAEFKLGVSNIFNNRSITDIGGDPTGNRNAGTGVVTNGQTYAFQSGRVIYGAVKVDF